MNDKQYKEILTQAIHELSGDQARKVLESFLSTTYLTGGAAAITLDSFDIAISKVVGK